MTAAHVSKSFGAAVVLDDVSLSIGPRTRLGIVGPNGIGKTTLLRILAGLDEPDSGSVERAPATLQVGYLPQEVVARAGETLFGYLARRTGVTDAEAHLDACTKAMEDDANSEAVEAYTDALDRFLALGGDDLRARAGEVCADVGLPAERLDVPMADLSGGQAARAALAAILLARFDVFLLDEPTNNLDFAGLDRLERFLTSLAGAVVVVSHDRAFLDRIAPRVLEIEEESHRAVEYAGGWSDYVAQKELVRTQQYEAFEKYQAERGRLAARLREQKDWAVSGVAKEKKRKEGQRERSAADFRINRTEKLAGKVKITEKRLERLDKVDKPWEGWKLDLQLAPEARSGDVVARLEGVVVRRGSFTLGPVDLEIGWQERVAIVGPNGGGKTTLLLALLGELPLAEGRRYLGPGVKVGSMDQRRDLFAGDEPVLDTFQRETGLAVVSEARSLLAKFGLGADHVARPGSRLSPGERTRAILATLMASGVNCLVLDEPTNHLDLAAIEELESALDGYEGTLLLVTHDRALLDSVSTTRTVSVEDGRVTAGGPPPAF
ncbi:MAG TPA: ABC-F family ATP-binding cassette domain-containing protein [Acidimicrobiales bacterium]|nr:ABC-F family ATP-binding cassette domain-containing protein [Acidimicrobiales bacterium]